MEGESQRGRGRGMRMRRSLRGSNTKRPTRHRGGNAKGAGGGRGKRAVS